MQKRSAALFLSAGLALVVGACGDDEGGEPVAIPRTPRGDASMDGADASRAQADAGTTPPRMVNACQLTSERIYEIVSTPEPISVSPIAVQARQGAFGMAFVERGNACVDAVRIAALNGGAEVSGPQLSTALDDCSKVEAAALGTAGDTFLLTAIDNREGATDLWAQAVSAFPEPDAMSVTDAGTDAGKPSGFRITDTPARETAVALAGYDDDTAMVAWVARDTSTGEETLRVRPLDAEGKPSARAVAIENGNGWNMARLSLSRIGGDMALAYHRFNAEGASETVLEILDPKSGEPSQDRRVLSDDAGPQPTIAVASDEDGGGVLFSRTGGVNARQLWFLRLGPDGLPAATVSGSIMGAPAEPQRLVGSPNRAIDGALAKLPTGYAVSYRTLPGGGVQAPQIDLVFLERVGRVLGKSRIADATASGSGTSLAFSIEGRLTIAWTDLDDDNVTHLRMARVPCVGGS